MAPRTQQGFKWEIKIWWRSGQTTTWTRLYKDSMRSAAAKLMNNDDVVRFQIFSTHVMTERRVLIAETRKSGWREVPYDGTW